MEVKVYQDRYVLPREITVGNQKENKTNKIIFDLTEVPQGHKYIVINMDGQSYPVPLINNELMIESWLTCRSGSFSAVVLVTQSPLGDTLNTEQTVFISDVFMLKVKSNFVGDMSKIEMPQALKIIYDDLLNLKTEIETKLKNGEFKGEKGDPYTHSEEFTQLSNEVKANAQKTEEIKKAVEVQKQAIQEEINKAYTNIGASIKHAETAKNEALKQAERAEQATTSKLDKNQGIENKGKVLVVGDNGEVVAVHHNVGNILIGTVEPSQNASTEDSYTAPFSVLNIHGKSTQDGVPSIEQPIPLHHETVAEIEVNNGKGESQKVVLSKPFTLYGKNPYTSDIVKVTPQGGEIVRKQTYTRLEPNWDWQFKRTVDGTYYVWGVEIPNAKGGASYKESLCDCFPYTVPTVLKSESFTYKDGFFWLLIRKERVKADLGLFRKWLEANPIYLLYELKEPTTEPLPLQDVEQLQKLHTYIGTTNTICNVPTSFEYERSLQIVLDELLNRQSIQLYPLHTEENTE